MRDGGRVWSAGTDSLRRTVRTRGSSGVLRDPSPPRATDALGARPRQPLVRPETPAEIAIYEDGDLGLFENTSGAFPGYDSYEAIASFVPGARLVSAAGVEAGVPVIAAWELGDGVAIHTGLPQLAEKARQGDPDADALVRRIWALLARGSGG